jgi:hypothetical protein
MIKYRNPHPYEGKIPEFEKDYRYRCVGQITDDISLHLSKLNWGGSSVGRSVHERHIDDETRHQYENYTAENTEFDHITPEKGSFFDKLGEMTRLGKPEVIVARMQPGRYTVRHQDFYNSYRKRQGINNITNNEVHKYVRRYWIPLEDWHSGHYYETNNQPIIGWSAGQVYSGPGDHPHLAANAGLTHRYFCIITGLINNNMFGDTEFEETKILHDNKK